MKRLVLEHQQKIDNTMRIKSTFPPICFESPLTGKTYIVCTGGKESSGWIEVNRWYSWNELEKMWDKITYNKPKEFKKVEVKKEWKVDGSKGNVYKVVNDGGFWSCSCPAHGFGRGKDCKHIIQIKNESERKQNKLGRNTKEKSKV
jgi:hypothetical protein